MNSVDGGDNSEVVWCDHVKAHGLWYGDFKGTTRKPVISIDTKGIKLVVEEGKIKLLCSTCFMKAIQLPMFTESERH